MRGAVMNARRGTRILMTTDTVGGVWTFSVTLARALGAAGYQVLLVTLGPGTTPAQRAMVSGYPGLSLIETDLQLEWQDPAGTDVGHARRVLQDIACRFEPDLVHCNGFREATFGWDVPVVVVAHSCVNSWAAACGQTRCFEGREWADYTAAVRAGLAAARVWVAPTSAFRDQVADQYGSATNSRVIWNGADGIGPPNGPKDPVILAAGRVWDKAKNLSALSSLASAIQWPIRIAGPSGVGAGATAIAPNGCEFLGELSHDALLGEMKAASIFISPALYEPFGLSALEAAGAGCALLLSDIPTFRELWHGAAMFFDPHDGEAAIGCLRSLCGDDVQRTRLQRAAIERARRYPLRNTVSAYRLLYGSLLAAPSGRPLMESGEMLA
jgi:glycosyltransferase involved in cell wall biosynthesis